VLIAESLDGGWGISGRANIREDVAGLARKALPGG